VTVTQCHGSFASVTSLSPPIVVARDRVRDALHATLVRRFGLCAQLFDAGFVFLGFCDLASKKCGYFTTVTALTSLFLLWAA
jgi:hypothetical protein